MMSVCCHFLANIQGACGLIRAPVLPLLWLRPAARPADRKKSKSRTFTRARMRQTTSPQKLVPNGSVWKQIYRARKDTHEAQVVPRPNKTQRIGEAASLQWPIGPEQPHAPWRASLAGCSSCCGLLQRVRWPSSEPLALFLHGPRSHTSSPRPDSEGSLPFECLLI